ISNNNFSFFILKYYSLFNSFIGYHLHHQSQIFSPCWRLLRSQYNQIRGNPPFLGVERKEERKNSSIYNFFLDIWYNRIIIPFSFSVFFFTSNDENKKDFFSFIT